MNRLIQKLKADEVALGPSICYGVAGVIEAIGKGWDWVWNDGQHGLFDYSAQSREDRTTPLEVARTLEDAVGELNTTPLPKGREGKAGLISRSSRVVW